MLISRFSAIISWEIWCIKPYTRSDRLGKMHNGHIMWGLVNFTEAWNKRDAIAWQIHAAILALEATLNGTFQVSLPLALCLAIAKMSTRRNACFLKWSQSTSRQRQLHSIYLEECSFRATSICVSRIRYSSITAQKLSPKYWNSPINDGRIPSSSPIFNSNYTCSTLAYNSLASKPSCFYLIYQSSRL